MERRDPRELRFRGILAANELPKYRDHGPGCGGAATTRTEGARARPLRKQRVQLTAQRSYSKKSNHRLPLGASLSELTYAFLSLSQISPLRLGVAARSYEPWWPE